MPCTFINTATVSGASNPTTVTGGTCNGGNSGGGSILPTNLNGILTMFNNVSTSNSPGGSNTTTQTFTKTTERQRPSERATPSHGGGPVA